MQSPQDHQSDRDAGAQPPRFICDAMLGGLARWLRAAGYSASFDVHMRDGELVRIALEQALCLLTSDSGVMERHAVSGGLVRTVFVPVGLSPLEQLGHVMGALGLGLRECLCMDCGGRLADVALEAVQEQVPPKVKESCERFFRCAGCGKVYWRGTHWEDIQRRLRAAASGGAPHDGPSLAAGVRLSDNETTAATVGARPTGSLGESPGPAPFPRVDNRIMSSAGKPRRAPEPKDGPHRAGAQSPDEQVRRLGEQLRAAQLRTEALEAEIEQLRASASLANRNEAELRTLAEQVERQQMLLERDEQVARELQRNLRPVLEESPPGLTFAIDTKPGTRVGGDFFDIINLSDNFVAFLIADVSGYGLPAAVIMATGRLAFRTYAANEINPRVIMDNVNKAMLRSTLAGHYLTSFLAVLDTELLTLQYVNASHCTPFVIRQGEVIPLDTEGLFVGMFEDPQYEQRGMQLERYDRIFLYTDGLLRGFEGRDRHEASRRLGDYLRENTQLSITELVAQLGSRLQDPEDDVALLGVETLLEKAQRKVIAISSIPSEVTRVEDAILPVLSNKGYGERYIFATKLALEEAVVNAIKHGNQLDDTKKVTISFSIDDDRAAVSVADEGEGFDPKDVPDPTLDENLIATSGRGLALIRAYMDEVRFNDRGTEITMIKYAPWAAMKKHT